MKEGGTGPNNVDWATNAVDTAKWISSLWLHKCRARRSKIATSTVPVRLVYHHTRRVKDAISSSTPKYQGSRFISMFIRSCPISNFGRWTPKP